MSYYYYFGSVGVILGGKPVVVGEKSNCEIIISSDKAGECGEPLLGRSVRVRGVGRIELTAKER